MIINLGPLYKAHNEFKVSLRKTISNALTVAGNAVKESVLNETSFKGTKLRKAVRFRKSVFSAKLSINREHASYLEHGTQPHEIRARRKRFLKFFWAEQGQVVFRKRVWHPGNRATHFWSRANQIGFTKMAAYLERAMPQLASRFNR